ncbi:MAG: transcription termination/antitermination protein NusG [Catonella sp.]|jgi:transcriptional antiterminator NusG|nr:transcription termination/antitermination protein NusG [Catonella sp.]
MAEAKWYVAHTYSGYENKVKADIEKTIANRHLEDQIFEVEVPTEDVTTIHDGSKREIKRKMLPGYVLVKMIMNDDTWYVVRNTRGVTGFVGPGSKPVPLTDEELEELGKPHKEVEIDLEVGDSVRITAGNFENSTGQVTLINNIDQTVTVNVDLFGRDTPVEVSFTDIEKV